MSDSFRLEVEVECAMFQIPFEIKLGVGHSEVTLGTECHS
jgi:hypothetical protein